MHDVTWRTGCTLTILLILVLLGSGKLLDGARPALTPLPAADEAESAIREAGPSTPAAARHTGPSPAPIPTGTPRLAISALDLPR